MSDYVLIDGDQVVYDATFGLATVTPLPAQLKGSGPTTLGNKPLCVDGDESSGAVSGCMYFTSIHSIPGTGKLEIMNLAPDQKALKTNSGSKPVLLLGHSFIAKFTPESPAQQPPPGPGAPIPDSTPMYVGTGSFVTTNTKFRGV